MLKKVFYLKAVKLLIYFLVSALFLFPWFPAMAADINSLQLCMNNSTCLDLAISNTGVKTALKNNSYSNSNFSLTPGGSMPSPPAFTVSRATDTIPAFGYSTENSSINVSAVNATYFDAAGLTSLRATAITAFCAADPTNSVCTTVGNTTWLTIYDIDINNPSVCSPSCSTWFYSATPGNTLNSVSGWYSTVINLTSGFQTLTMNNSGVSSNTSNRGGITITKTSTTGMAGYTQPQFTGNFRINPTNSRQFQVQVKDVSGQNTAQDWTNWSDGQKGIAIGLLTQANFLPQIKTYLYAPNPPTDKNVLITVPNYASFDNGGSYINLGKTFSIDAPCTGPNCSGIQTPTVPPGNNANGNGDITTVPGPSYDSNGDGSDIGIAHSQAPSLQNIPNFLQNFLSTASNKFPFDVFGTLPQGIQNVCPSISVTPPYAGTQSYQLCEVNTIFEKAKYPVWLSWAFKLIRST